VEQLAAAQEGAAQLGSGTLATALLAEAQLIVPTCDSDYNRVLIFALIV
jgi:hypothetical protein